MEPITLLRNFEFERRLTAAGNPPSPRARHLAEARVRRTAERTERLRAWVMDLVPVRRPVATPEPCGC